MLARINWSRSAVPALASRAGFEVLAIFMELQSAICAYSTSVQFWVTGESQGLAVIIADSSGNPVLPDWDFLGEARRDGDVRTELLPCL